MLLINRVNHLCSIRPRVWPNSRYRLSFSRCRSEALSSSKAQLADQQQEKLKSFMDLLLEKNKVMNLTAVTDPAMAWERHVEDSLALLPILDDCNQHCKEVSLIDVGSGAGLPGIIIAIARPDWKETLLDSLQKRCVFVEEVIRKLGIDNAATVCARAESAGQQFDHREVYDCALARAVAEMRVLAELSLPLVRLGGFLVAAKGPKPQAEVQQASSAIDQLGGCLNGIHEVESFSQDGQRTAVVIQKISPTPKMYPRKDGRPQKRPL